MDHSLPPGMTGNRCEEHFACPGVTVQVLRRIRLTQGPVRSHYVVGAGLEDAGVQESEASVSHSRIVSEKN